ncbi:hypothetical protein LguiA_025603 [Lonicera macranthoides]
MFEIPRVYVAQYSRGHNFVFRTPNNAILESILKKISRVTTFQFKIFSNSSISGFKTSIRIFWNEIPRANGDVILSVQSVFKFCHLGVQNRDTKLLQQKMRKTRMPTLCQYLRAHNHSKIRLRKGIKSKRRDKIFPNVIDREDYHTIFSVFGVKNVASFLQRVPEDRLFEAISSYLLEATAGIENPVRGCTALLASFEQKVEELQARVTALEARLGGGSSCVNPLCSFAPPEGSSRFFSSVENNVPNVIPTAVNLSEPIAGGFLRLLMSEEGVQNLLSTSTNLVENGAPLTEMDWSYDQAALDAVYQGASNNFLSQSALDDFVVDFAEPTGLDWTASGNIHHDFFDSSSSDLSTIMNSNSHYLPLSYDLNITTNNGGLSHLQIALLPSYFKRQPKLHQSHYYNLKALCRIWKIHRSNHRGLLMSLSYFDIIAAVSHTLPTQHKTSLIKLATSRISEENAPNLDSLFGHEALGSHSQIQPYSDGSLKFL